MGSISERDTGSGGLDAELQQVSSSDLLYTGAPGDTQRAIISGRTTNVDGDQVCADGAYEGEVCSAVIQSHGDCVTLDTGRYVCEIAKAKRSDNTPVTGPGDSGGPIFEFSGSNLLVVGTDTGQIGSSVNCTSPYSQGYTCGTGVAYTEIGPELSDFAESLTVNTG
jgi:hypothetical protein